MRERAQTLHGVACTVVEAANEELTILADEVAAAGSTAQAHAVSAVQGLQAHGVATQQMVEAKIEAVKEQAVTAAKASLWGVNWTFRSGVRGFILTATDSTTAIGLPR